MSRSRNADQTGEPGVALQKELTKAIGLLGILLETTVAEKQTPGRKRSNREINWSIPGDVLRNRIIPAFDEFFVLVETRGLFRPIDANTPPNPLDELYEQANKVRNHLSGPWGSGGPLHVPYTKDECVRVATEALTFVKGLNRDTFLAEYEERRQTGRWDCTRESSGPVKRCWANAFRLFSEACGALGREHDDPPSDREAFEWLQDRGKAGLPRSEFTFSRYLRAYRKAVGLPPKRAPKWARTTSRSVVRRKDL